MAKIQAALDDGLGETSIFSIDERDDYPDSLGLVIVSDAFDGVHEVDVSNLILEIFKKALGEDFYSGIYSFLGLSKSAFETGQWPPLTPWGTGKNNML
jgi:stress-induced morphogen